MTRSIFFISLILLFLGGCSMEKYACGEYYRHETDEDYAYLTIYRDFTFRYSNTTPYAWCSIPYTKPYIPLNGRYRRRNDSVFLHFRPTEAYQDCHEYDSSYVIRGYDGLFEVIHHLHEDCKLIPADSSRVHLVFYKNGCFYDRKMGRQYRDQFSRESHMPYIPAPAAPGNIEEAIFRRYYLD